MTPEQANTLKYWFDQYRSEICTEVINISNKSFVTPNMIGDMWRKNFEYNRDTENHIRIFTCAFLKNVSEDVPAFRDVNLLIALIKRICEFLSVYTQRAYGESTIFFGKQSEQQDKEAAKLFQIFFTGHTALQKGLERHKREEQAKIELQESKQPTEKPKRQRKRLKTCSVVLQTEEDQEIYRAVVLERKIKLKRKELAKFMEQEKMKINNLQTIQIIINTK